MATVLADWLEVLTANANTATALADWSEVLTDNVNIAKVLADLFEVVTDNANMQSPRRLVRGSDYQCKHCKVPGSIPASYEPVKPEGLQIKHVLTKLRYIKLGRTCFVQ